MKRINLIPPEVRRKRLTAQRRNLKLAGAVALGVVVLGLFFWQDLKISSSKNSIDRMNKELKSLEGSKEEMSLQFEQIQLEREKVKLERQQLAQKIALLHQSQQKGSSWSTALIQISELLPEKIWLKKIYLSEKAISIAGASTDNFLISKFMGKLDASQMFNNTDFKYIQKVEFEEVPYIEFEITTEVVLSEIKR